MAAGRLHRPEFCLDLKQLFKLAAGLLAAILVVQLISL